jgi:opacity protein-like surface antigen
MPKPVLAAAAAICLLLAHSAHAEANLYLQLDAGPTFAQDADVSDHRGPNNGQIRYEHSELNVFRDMGWNGGGAIGVHWNRSSKHSFRFDLSGGYHRADINKLVVDGVTLARGGHTSVASGMLNGYYEHDFGNLAWFKAFVGGGAGVGFVDFEGPRSSSLVFIDDEATEFAWNATAGVVLPLSDHVELTGAYRYFSTVDPTLEARQRDPNTGATQTGNVDVELGMHDVVLGVRFTF